MSGASYAMNGWGFRSPAALAHAPDDPECVYISQAKPSNRPALPAEASFELTGLQPSLVDCHCGCKTRWIDKMDSFKFTTAFGLLAVEMACELLPGGQAGLTHVLAATFFVLAVALVDRSFCGMRIQAQPWSKDQGRTGPNLRECATSPWSEAARGEGRQRGAMTANVLEIGPSAAPALCWPFGGRGNDHGRLEKNDRESELRVDAIFSSARCTRHALC